MAAVDALVRLIAAQSADALLLSSDQVPRLSRAGASQPLSMPPIGAGMMASFVAEVLTPEQMAEVRGPDPLVVDYGEFAASVKRVGEGWAMSIKKRGATRPPDPARGRPAPPATSPGTIAAPPPAPTTSSAPPPAPIAAQPASIAAGGAAPPSATPPGADAPGAAAPAAAPFLDATAPPPSSAAGWTASHPDGGPAEARHDLLDHWLRQAIDDQATDLVISSGRGARLRIPGGLVGLAGDPLDDTEIAALFAPHLGDVHRTALGRHGSTDFALVWRDPGGPGDSVRFRVNLFRQGTGLAAVLRPVRRDPPALADLNLPEGLSRLARFPNGIVLVTGPAGAGKSTTMVALVEQLNRELPRHILTLEDPIEYEYRPQLSLIHQREIGTHVDSFESGLRAALREAPDLILLGEMRDRATMAAAMTAAETGHLVISSMHAGHAAMAVERIVDAFPEHQQRQVRGQLAGSLRAVLTQHLLPGARRGSRVPAIELLIGTSGVASLIRDGKTHQLATAIQTGREDGMLSLDRSLADLVEAGAITYETALGVTLDGGHQVREYLGRGGHRGGRPSR